MEDYFVTSQTEETEETLGSDPMSKKEENEPASL